MSGFREHINDCGMSVRDNFANDTDKSQPWLYYKNPAEDMTDYECDNFDKLMRPTNFGKSVGDVDISGAAEWLESNFDMLIQH